jgi:hypothetical protein
MTEVSRTGGGGRTDAVGTVGGCLAPDKQARANSVHVNFTAAASSTFSLG